MNIEKVYTDNPLLDEIVYNCKQLAIGTVLKDQTRADNEESAESLNAGDAYVAIKQRYINFSAFYYDKEFLSNFPNISAEDAEKYSVDNELIPVELRKQILDAACKEFLDTYVEKNNYYRMLNGEPNYDRLVTYDGLYVDFNTINNAPSNIKVSKFYRDTPGTDYRLIHQLDIGMIEVLYDNGFIDSLFDSAKMKSLDVEYKDIEYLKHIGNRKIDYYTSRSAEKFGLIYCPDSEAVEVKNKYKDKLEANRKYMLYTIYSDAYKINSENYDNFMMVFLVLQTVVDLIVELPDYVIRRDVFDSRTCEYIFESNGVKYFRDIPLIYQIALVKNLNKLIKFKSSDKCIVDIVSVFGVPNIKVFKYYILKDRNVNNEIDNEYVANDDIDKDYTLKFIKVPIMEKYDDYIRTNNNILTYDAMTESDRHWIGDKEYDVIKSNIKNMDFTVLRSKYYSVEALIDLTKRNFTLVYFMNILLYNKVDKSKLLVNLPHISTSKKFELVDVIIFLYSLGYLYYGIEDTVMDSRKKIAEVLGFNTEADLQEIANYLNTHFDGLTLEELGVEGYTIPKANGNNEILSFKQLENLYFTNTKIYDHVRKMLIDPPNKRIYDAYKYIYKSLFIMKCNMDYYKLSNGNMASTYRQFLQEKDPLLYETLSNLLKITNLSARRESVVNTIQSTIQYLKDYVNRDIVNLDDVFAGLPSISLDFVKKYVEEVIDFFKSFKIFTHDSSILYMFSDKFENYVQLVEWVLFLYKFDKSEFVHVEDWIGKSTVSGIQKDRLDTIDKIWMEFDTWVEHNFEEYYESERYQTLTNKIRDELKYNSHFYVNETDIESAFNKDSLSIIMIDLLMPEKYEIGENIRIVHSKQLEEYVKDSIIDLIYALHINITPDDRSEMRDELTTTCREYFKYRYQFGSRIASMKARENKKDIYAILDECYMIRTNK